MLESLAPKILDFYQYLPVRLDQRLATADEQSRFENQGENGQNVAYAIDEKECQIRFQMVRSIRMTVLRSVDRVKVVTGLDRMKFLPIASLGRPVALVD